MVQSKLASITAVLTFVIFINSNSSYSRGGFMRILVTGAQGCIGAWVVRALLGRGLDVLAYDLEPEPARLSLIAPPDLVKQLAIQTGRIEDTERVKSLVKAEGITHIVHLAAVLMPFCQANPV